MIKRKPTKAAEFTLPLQLQQFFQIYEQVELTKKTKKTNRMRKTIRTYSQQKLVWTQGKCLLLNYKISSESIQ